MRNLLAIAVLGVLSLGLPATVAAQDGASVGDSGPAEGDFDDTDGGCGFPNFTDSSYVATLGEDERGVYIDFTQESTGDSVRFRSDGDGNITVESDGDEVYADIRIEGDNILVALYSYTSGDCTQQWKTATLTFPSGFIDTLIAGNAAPITTVPVTTVPETTVPETTVPATTMPATTVPDTTVPAAPSTVAEPSAPAKIDDDGFDWARFGLLGLLLLFLLALLLALYRRFAPRRLYRFDRGDGGIILKPAKPEDGGTDEEPADVDSGPPAVIVDDGEAAPDAPPPPERNCEPEREEFAMAQEAKDAAFGAGEQADRELAEAKDEYFRLQATLTNPLGENHPEVEVDDNASEADRARAQRVHALNMAEWQKFEDQATEAQGKLAGAKAAYDKARADSAEAWEDFQRMRRRLEAARTALDNCDGSAPPADDDEPTGGEPGSQPDGGGDTGAGPPGVITDPPEPTPDPEEEEGCVDDAEQDGKVVSTTEFPIAGGNITVEVGTSDWAEAGNSFSPEAFADLDISTVEDLSAGIEMNQRAVRISVRIPTVTVTVKCVQILVCENKKWVDSGRTKRVEDRAPGPDIHVLPTGAAGGIAKSKDRRHAGRMVEKAQAKLETLQKNEEDAADCDCD